MLFLIFLKFSDPEHGSTESSSMGLRMNHPVVCLLLFSFYLNTFVIERLEDKIKDICLFEILKAFLIGNYYNFTILLLQRGLRTK